jgi:GT2 family glycosyltransferase
VHYRDAEAVAHFASHVAALPLQDGTKLSVAIADNSADWPAAIRLPECAHLYRPGENRGYLPGCAFAHDRWTADSGRAPDWVAVANTDLVFDPGFFPALLSLPLDESVGVVAPNVRLPDGTPQNPFLRRRPRRLRIYAYTLIYRSMALTAGLQWMHRVKGGWKRRSLRSLPAPQNAPDSAHCEEIYAAHGSVFFLRDTFFSLGGSLRYPGFMYGEELYIAEQARRLGLRTVWIPSAKVEHAAHAATGVVARRRRLAWMREGAQIAWNNDFYANR